MLYSCAMSLFSLFNYSSPRKPIPYLPDTVLLRLVQYAAGVHMQLPACHQNTQTDQPPRSLLPYMAVCRTWRSMISVLYYREAVLNLGPKNALDMLDRPALHKAAWVAQIGHVSDIRRLHVIVPVGALGTSALNSIVTKELTPFWSANVLEIILHLHSETPDLEIKLDGRADRIAWFIDTLNYAMPRATSLSVMNNSTMRAGDLTGLLEIINKTVPSKRSLGFELDLQGQHPFLTISGPPALTNISIAARNWTDAHIGFVRYHCDTLRMLTVHNITTWSFEQLLVDGERSNIVYPNLLVLDAELRLSMQAPSLNLQRTPFPALRCLRNKGFYPFNSDIALYTGQPSTLEYLRLPLDTVLFNTLSASNAFKSRKYPVLRTAEIFFNNSPFVVAEAVQGWSMFATIFEIAEAAKVFRCNIRVNRSAPVLINMRPSFSLEHLYLPWFGIDLAGFPLLCLKFPKLRSVACTLIDAIDGISEDMPKDESIQAALSTKRIRSKLATLEIFGETWVRNYRRFAQYVVLLVALLPSVKELVYWPYASEEAPEAKRQLTAALNRTAYRDMYHVKTLKVDIKTHYTYLEDVYRKQFPLQ